MYNALIALAVGLLVALGVKLAGFSLWAGLIPGTVAFVGVFILLARRIGQKMQVLVSAAQKELSVQPVNAKDRQQRLERGIQILEKGLVYKNWQPLVASEIHAQIGMLKYVSKDLDGAQQHLARANPRNAMAQAMSGALYFQKKDPQKMRRAFNQAVKAGKKDPLVWVVYAWCLGQLKQRDEALSVLSRAVEANPNDSKLKASLTSLQNDKKLKMKAYEPGWWQFGLESPPIQTGGQRRVQFQRR